jgi:predicted Zn-dependent protease
MSAPIFKVRSYIWGKLRFFAYILFIGLFLASCATAPYTGRRQLILLSSGQELALGQRAAQQILHKTRLSNDPHYVNLVENLGWRIAKVVNRPDFQWEFHVIDDAETANAFCLPGGKIFVYTGIFKYAQTEAELATVIGHEIAHVLARHGAERMSMQLLAQMGEEAAAQALQIQSPGALKTFEIAYGLGTNIGLILPYSRTQEFEADHIGLILMAKAGYNPEAAIGFWQKMASEAKGFKPPAFLSTHPADEARINRIKTMLPEALEYYRAGQGRR